MSRICADLLAADRLASKFGCSLNPKLRQALEAELRFPARSAGPTQASPDLVEGAGDRVVRLESVKSDMVARA